MAEFKISRLRYTWRDEWVSTESYNKDDVVRFGGSSWVCIRQHVASAFAADQIFLENEENTEVSPAWKLMTEGYAWRGLWESDELYSPGDIALYGGVLYLCINSNTTSTFDNNIDDWVMYAQSQTYRENWNASTRYGVGDIAKYNGIVYRCVEGHTANNTTNGLEADQEKWAVFYEGIQFRGNWATETRYRVNDLVKFGGTVFRCKQGHTSGSDSTLNFDQDEHWEIEFPGFQFDNEWNNATVYQVGDVVRHGGNVFYALNNNYNSNPRNSIYQIEDRVDPVDWEILIKATNFRGTWSSTELYKTGDLVRRGGNLYIALLDTTDDGSSLDYLDATNWELITVAQNWRNFWQEDVRYSINDLVIFSGTTYKCNTEHDSSDENYPGDNGSGFFFWDIVLLKGADTGLRQRGDLLTYDLDRTLAADGSSFGETNVELGTENHLLSINDTDSVIYKEYGQVNRVVYVATNGVDDDSDIQRGVSPFKPWKTIRYAAERVNDGFSGTTTIRVAAGIYEEILPIVIPQRTVVLGTELRTTTIKPAGPVAALSLDSTYTIAVLSRISQLIQGVLLGQDLVPPKSSNNPLDPVVVEEVIGVVPFDPPRYNELLEEIFDPIYGPVNINPQTVIDVRRLILNIQSYINYHINDTGTDPVITGSNTPLTSEVILNAVSILEANKEFLAAEATAFMQTNYPSYAFNVESCKRDVRRYVEAWIYDITYPGNYKSLMAARYYRNAVLGSLGEDMFYCRDATGVRNCTLSGLTGTLPPGGESISYRIPTGGAYVSLDPGWGPDDNHTWILTRSPYIQGVTTFGNSAIGQKIDGALHNGGNRSMVSNDFTQIISDGIGAWVANGGRAELVSVFTYYSHVGYLTTNGGIIRATNGNNSYGDYGAVADGVDDTETPIAADINNRNQEASVASAFAGDFVDEIQILEWSNAGQNYSSAVGSFVGAGVNASVVFDDFRDNAVFEARLVDTSSTIVQTIGGSGYSIVQNNAQAGGLLTITLASNDPNTEEDYIGMRIVLTSGPGTGQYAYISDYDEITKIATVARESDDQAGWDHVVPGKAITELLTTGTTYRIEPRVTFSAPEYSATEVEIPATTTWSAITFGNTTETYNNISGTLGTGDIDTDLQPAPATFNITKLGRDYQVTTNTAGAGYAVGDVLTISGELLSGIDSVNDLIITVTAVSDDSTNSIVTFTSQGTAASGKFVAVSTGGSAATYSDDGENWTSFNMPSSGNWNCIEAGNNRFVAIRTGSAVAASSLNGITWTARTLPASRQWSAIKYAQGIFFAVARNLNAGAISVDGTTWESVTLPTAGDSTINEWVDVTYGKGRFVVLANSNNLVVAGTYNALTSSFTWDLYIMDTIDDSSQKDWVSIAYGNNRFVAISATGEVAYSFDAAEWFPATLPTQDGSTAHNWKKIKYAQGVFFAVGDTGAKTVGDDPTTGPSTFAATSFDGIVWTNRELASDEEWVDVAFGSPYVSQYDSTVGRSTPVWVALANNSNKVSKVQTGARALGRAIVVAGVLSAIRLWDTGSGYLEAPTVEIFAPGNNTDASVECRIGDGVLTNPSWINRGLGYRTLSTTVTITGDGFADQIPQGKFITISNLPKYFGPGALITFNGEDTRYTAVTVAELGIIPGAGLSARVRVSPEIKNRDNLLHAASVTIRERYSQCRITGHDFLDVGTGNFERTNYPDIYTGLIDSAPENEILSEDGGRVFYTATDQNGNFRTGELFAVEQASGIVTISADFFDFSGLTELRLGGIRLGGTGAVVREFSTDPLFTEDSNNVVPTQRAIRAYLQGRLSVGGSEIAVGSFIAGTVLVGPDIIRNVAGLKVIVPVRADFEGTQTGVSGSILAQTMFYKSF